MIIVNENTDPRQINFGNIVYNGGSNRASIYAIGDELYFDGELIPTTKVDDTGLLLNSGKWFFNGFEITSSLPPDADDYLSPEGYWIPETQPSALDEKNQSYETLLGKYDALMTAHPDYITKKRYEDELGNPYLTVNGGYEMFSYTFEPESYTKTFVLAAGVHGNEKDAPIQTYRILEALCNKTNTAPYAELKQLRDNVKFVVVPIVSPFGYNDSTVQVPYPGSGSNGINMNRNYDFVHQYGTAGGGVGGNVPFDMVELRHVRDIIVELDPVKVDFYCDMHDGGGVMQHYWVNFNPDYANAQPTKDFINYLIDKYEIVDPIIPNVKDSASTGIAMGWGSRTMGIVSSTIEWMGGYLGYDFSPSQMTQSMELRANVLLMAYKQNWKASVINPIGSYFNFDTGKSFTRATLRKESSGADTKVSDADIYGRWDLLMSKNPTLITKSALLGYDAYGTQPIHSYTFGNGATKVLYVGGVMRWGGTHKIDEYAIYQLIEYLCDASFVNQSTHLQELLTNYKIVVLPCIDNTGGNATTIRDAGLNQSNVGTPRWQIVADKATPTTYGSTNHGVVIIKNFVDAHTDAKLIVSGGENMEGYGTSSDYPTDYETQFIIPRKATFDLSAYKAHLETNRVENVNVANTLGRTFADYAYDNHGLITYFINLKTHQARYEQVLDDLRREADDYMYHTWNAGRRISNIVNVFLK